MNDTCMICGADIPEGGQVCRNCQKEYDIKWGDSIMEKVYQKGFKDGQKELLATGNISFVNVRISEKSIDEAVQKAIDRAEINGVPLKQYASERSEGHWTVGFETAMNIIRAKAREMGSQTKYSASEAFEYMAISNVMTAIKTTVTNIWSSVKTAVSNTITGIKDSIVNGFNVAVDFVKNLTSEAWNWGADIISNIVTGIKNKISSVADAVTGVADTIREFLHFSVPDKGPLTDFESWMPDFHQWMDTAPHR